MAQDITTGDNLKGENAGFSFPLWTLTTSQGSVGPLCTWQETKGMSGNTISGEWLW